MGTTVVGISAYYHDSACCLLHDGELVCAAEEERFSRVKHDKGTPWRAFRFCLEQAGVSISELDCLAFYEDPRKKLERQLWMGLQSGGGPILERTLRRLRDGDWGESLLRDSLGYDGRIEFVDHHLSHAASAYCFSGFPESALLTVDGVGEWATTTYGTADGSYIELFEEVEFPHSLGLLYSTITAYLSFEVNDGEYKVMGLAPYGKPVFIDAMRELLSVGPGADFCLHLEYFDFLRAQRMYSERLPELFGHPTREPESELQTWHYDIACSLQTVLEETLLEQTRYLYERTSSENLCMAGGVALNCVANTRILRDGPFKHLFVQPAAGDAGGALGAAAIAHTRLSSEPPPRKHLSHVYLGPSYGCAEIANLLAGTAATSLDFRNLPEQLLDATVDRLLEGKVVGWFQGRMEFGPRALGARSILADPRAPHIRDRVNELVKKRESFRPFAPAVLAERAADHFDIDHPSPFMLETFPVVSPLQLPAVTHVDGTARVQTVDAAQAPRFAHLLQRFEQRSGCPLLLNTSFNVRGEPIVCTPLDAIRCFVGSGLDALVLEDFILDRESIPTGWKETVDRQGSPTESAVSHDVYALV